MRFTLFGEAEGVLSSSTETFWALAEQGLVVDASVPARQKGIVPGMKVSVAEALLPGLTVEEGTGSGDVMQEILARLWAFSPWLETVGARSFFLQIPASAPPLRETRRLLSELEQILTSERRTRIGLAENPFLARSLVEWSRYEKIPGAQYYKVGEQQWVNSPALVEWARSGRRPARFGEWIASLPVPAMWFVDNPTRVALQRLGVQRWTELERISPAHLVRHFGKEFLLWFHPMHLSPGGTVRVNYPPEQRRVTWRASVGEEISAAALPEILSGLCRSLASGLERDGIEALKAGFIVEGERGNHCCERVAKRPIHSSDALYAVLSQGLLSVDVGLLHSVDLYVGEFRLRQTTQCAWSIHRGALVAEDLVNKDVERLMRQVNRKFPKRLQLGIRPSFREQRMQAVLTQG